jgi:serine/threonine protein phosphatase PrpC
MELRVIQKWLILASDGLWDVMTEKDVFEVLKQRQTPDEVSKFLVKRAV